MTQKLQIRPITVDESDRVSLHDYDICKGWWTARGGAAPDRFMLSQCGSVAEYDKEPIAVAFMYLDCAGSGVAEIGWLATNPSSSKFIRGKALKLLIENLTQIAKDLNYWIVSCNYENVSLIRSLCKSGFQIGHTGMTQLFKKI